MCERSTIGRKRYVVNYSLEKEACRTPTLRVNHHLDINLQALASIPIEN